MFREVLVSGRKEVTSFDTRGLLEPLPLLMLLGLSGYSPVVGQMEGCGLRKQNWWCGLVAEQCI